MNINNSALDYASNYPDRAQSAKESRSEKRHRDASCISSSQSTVSFSTDNTKKLKSDFKDNLTNIQPIGFAKQAAVNQHDTFSHQYLEIKPDEILLATVKSLNTLRSNWKTFCEVKKSLSLENDSEQLLDNQIRIFLNLQILKGILDFENGCQAKKLPNLNSENIKEKDLNGRNILHYVVALIDETEAIPLIKKLSVCQMNFGVQDNFSNTALHYALALKKHELAKIIIEDDCQLVNKVCRRHISINAADSNGNWPIHLAALIDNYEIINLLVKSGIKCGIKNRQGHTPYQYLCKVSKNRQAIHLLLNQKL